jgi:sugar phosphate permease
MAEAGFFPGVVYYLSLWFPAKYRARAMSGILIGIPLSQVLGAPLGGVLLGLTGIGHLSGWQWLFLVEGLPSVLLGIVALVYLTDRPEHAQWLSKEQRDWVSSRIAQEQQLTVAAHVSPLRALGHPLLWVLVLPYFALCAIGYGATFWAPLLDRCAWAALGLAFYCIGGVGVALLPHSILRVVALVILQIGNPIFMCSFWCVPSKLLQGSSAAAGIALVSSIGTSGGFFGPSIIGFLKQTTGSDSGAFLGLAGLALIGAFVCLGLRRTAAFTPNRRSLIVMATTP